MRDKTKKTKKEIKFRDLKPVKDAKGGIPPGPCGPGKSSPSTNRDYPGNHNEVFLADVS
jgi:hypothetical protein